MATKKDARKEAKDAAERAAGSGPWRVLVPFAGAALAALGPALALGGKTMRDRREKSSRMPGLAVIPIVGALLTVLGAVVWQNRGRVLVIAGDALATAAEVAGDLTGRLTGDSVPDEPTMSDSPYKTFGVPSTQGAPAA